MTDLRALLARTADKVLADVGWDVERDGLAGARLSGSWRARSAMPPSTARCVCSAWAPARFSPCPRTGTAPSTWPRWGTCWRASLPGPTIVCLQSGNVNTGACDDLAGAVAAAHEHGAWAHVDGAFGLWAAASPAARPLVAGIETADSWGTDGHKWLNVPYDSG